MDFSSIENLGQEQIDDIYRKMIDGDVVEISNQLFCFRCANGTYACYCDSSGGSGGYSSSWGYFCFYSYSYGAWSTSHACGIGVCGYGRMEGYCPVVGNTTGRDKAP